jgi:antitoxin component of MazEF toxin-antitoxin module
MKTYKQEEIFQDIPGNKSHVVMNIPPEVAKQAGWVPGDKLSIKTEKNGSIKITKVIDE